MQAAYAKAMGGEAPLENLEVGELPPPEPGPGQALVRVEAVSLNHHDLWTLRGQVGTPITFPRILGCDAGGVVEAYGPDRPAGTPEPGSAVVLYPVIPCGTCEACLGPDESLCREFGMLSDKVDGTLGEYVVLPAANVLPRPAGLSAAEAASLGTTYLTAYRALFTRAGLRPGQSVLIQGASGGLSTAAIQLARAGGLRVYATSRDEAKRQRALDAGAHEALDTNGAGRAILQLTNGRGVDCVVDSVGEPTWRESLRAVRAGGSVVVPGATGGGNPPADLNRVFWRQLSIIGSSMGTRAEMLALIRMVEASGLRPILDETFPLAETRQAMERMQAGQHTGKIIVTVGAG
jgi:NADPH:quinone reductase-like Zn-dependent oxidoreductase